MYRQSLTVVTRACCRCDQLASHRWLHISLARRAEALRDEAIRSRFVRLVDTDGNLPSSADNTQRLLRSIDRSRYWLQQVKAGKEVAEDDDEQTDGAYSRAGPSIGGGRGRRRPDASRDDQWQGQAAELDDLPIVKLVDKKETYNKEKARKQDKKGKSVASSGSAHKDIDLTWNSTTHDMEHKLKSIRSHLLKRGAGAQGKVTIKAKSGRGAGGGVSAEGKEKVIQQVEATLFSENEKSESADESASQYAVRRSGEISWKAGNSRAELLYQAVKK